MQGLLSMNSLFFRLKKIPLDAASGRITAIPILSKDPVQIHLAARDGIPVFSHETAGFSGQQPVALIRIVRITRTAGTPP